MKISRRHFLVNLGYGAFLVASGAVATMFARFLTPNITTSAPGPIEIGHPDEYAVGSLTHIDYARVYLGRDPQGFYALVAICTHLGCTPRLDGSGFACPCHGSRFALDGRVIAAPATRALDRAFVGRHPNGKLFIDRSRLVDTNYRLTL